MLLAISTVRAALIVALVTLLVAANWAAISGRNPSVPERKITHRPVQVEDDGYRSSETCRMCHPSEYTTWHGSYHRTMTQLAAPETVRADFDGVRVSLRGDTISLERRGKELWAEFEDPDRDGSSNGPARITRQVVLVTGSHQQQVYWYRTDHNRLLGQLPAMYLIGDRRWIPRQEAFLHPPEDSKPSETGRWNAVCVDCHATNGKRQLSAPLGSKPIGSLVADTTVGEFGIACEACHGPGELHIAANRNPLRRYWFHVTGRPDTTSVEPTRLSARLSSQICGQCHGIWVPYARMNEHAGRSAQTMFRPGNDLDQTHFVLQPSKNIDTPVMKTILASDPNSIIDSFWSDGMARVSGREYNGLIDSPCFKEAPDQQRTMSCSSCHAMHKAKEDTRSIQAWADTHQLSGRTGNEACLQCHPSLRANLPSHTYHQADSSGSACYNCHMPYTSYGLLKAVRSHQVSSPTATETVLTGRPNACNACHLDKTLSWTSDYLQKWYGTPQTQLDRDERTIAASMLSLLRGDAGERALVAWSMGWKPAQDASGTSWMPPSLGLLMNDPYAAVRFIASRSLQSLPEFARFNYDFISPPEQRPLELMKVMDVWRRSNSFAQSRNSAALLFETDGTMKPDVQRLLNQRDHRRVELRE
jgi:hypothetical protein